MAILYKCNLFITIYKTTVKRLQNPANLSNIRIILNPQIHLFLKKRADFHCNNLPNANEVLIMIPDEYKKANFKNFVLSFQRFANDVSILQNISSIIVVYTSLHYLLLFPYRDFG